MFSWRRRSVRDHYPYDYAVFRVVPRVEREEFVNVGVIVSCPPKIFSRPALNWMSSGLWRLIQDLMSNQSGPIWRPSRLSVLADSRQGQLANYHRGSASTGWWRPEARQSRHPLCTPVAARTQPKCLSTCSTRWCALLAQRQTPHSDLIMLSQV